MGLDLIEAGGSFGSDGAYGSALIKTGQAEQRLGQCERDFIANTGICFIQPLKKFLDGEMRTITKEKGVLEAKRLDLDAAKSRVRKARSLIGTQSVSNFDRKLHKNSFLYYITLLIYLYLLSCHFYADYGNLFN